MKVKVEVNLRGLIEVDVLDANAAVLEELDLPVGLEQFEEVAGTTIDWDDVYASVPVEVNMVHASKNESLGNGTQRRPTIDSVAREVSIRYGVKINDLRGPKRWFQVSRPRMVAMYLARKLTGASFPEIGRWFWDRNHSTIIHAVRKIEQLLPLDVALRDKVEAVEQSVAWATEVEA